MRTDLQAVLFDMDGTLVETEQYWGEALQALARRLGGVLSDEGREATVRGCVERDAASRAPVYKLVAQGEVFHLEPAGKVDLAGALGHTVEATGTVTKRVTGRNREENVMAVRAIKSISPNCS